MQMEVGVGAVAVHRHDGEIAAKVSRVQARQGDAVAVSREDSLLLVGPFARDEFLRGDLCGGEHIGEDLVDAGAGDAAALVRHLYADVLAAVGDDDLDDGERAVLEGLDGGADGVFEELEEAEKHMTLDVRKLEVLVAENDDLRGVAILAVRDAGGGVCGGLGDFRGAAVCADDADEVALGVCGREVGDAGGGGAEGDVLADEHADADAGHVEAVEEGVDGELGGGGAGFFA
mmetsp:Transcript_5696/g.14884  ORF Transcript_5696/g.14884 Transcript_5696/m.14884 type:complete len:232 (+) Transcript_5696:903-1598(+)